jgi:predicted permease
VTHNIRYALRMINRNKGWSVVAILSLALGIGLNTALFSIANDLLFQKLAVSHPDELVTFRWAGQNDLTAGLSNYGFTRPDPVTGHADSRHTGAAFSSEVFRQFWKQSEGLADIVAFVPIFNLNVIADGQAEFTNGQYISGDFYKSLGVGALRGRTIIAADDSASAEPVVIISYDYWKRRFAMAESAIGKKVTINKGLFTIVGIAPDGLGNLTRAGEPAPSVSIPLAFEPVLARLTDSVSRTGTGYWGSLLIGRLKAGATLQQMQSRLEPSFEATVRDEWTRALALMSPQRRASPEISQAGKVPRLQVVPGSKGVFEASPIQSQSLMILTVVAAIVLLIVCTNVANLLLSRTTARRHEFAVRTAIGATRLRLIGQMLTESLVIAGIAGLLGLLLSYWSRALIPVWLGFRPVGIDWRVIGFALGATFTTGTLFGVIPALRGTRMMGSRLKNRASRIGKPLVVVQVTLSLVLLIGAGLFLRTLQNLRHVDAGFDTSNLIIFRIVPGLNQYDSPALAALYERILDGLPRIPGVRSATFSTLRLLVGEANTADFSIDGKPPVGRRSALEVHHNFFDTMGIPVKLGRAFTAQDNEASPAVTVINEAFAKEFFLNENPIGHRLQQTFPGAPVTEIIGVVGDARYADVRAPAPPIFYIHDMQRPIGMKTVVVRTSGDAGAAIPAVREFMQKIDPLLPLQLVSTQSDNIERSISQERIVAFTSSLFGALALLISMIGLFGLMSYTVARRTKEIGIRMAIGAGCRDVLRSVLRETFALVAIGIALGVAVALASTRLIASRLYGLAPHDVPTIALAILLMLAAASPAAYWPARRASRVDPLTALRYE